MNRKNSWRVLSFFWLAVVAGAANAAGAADTHDVVRSITVTGTGAITIKPDTACIRLSVNTRSDTVEAATQENARRMASVQKTILGLGIDKEAFSTANYNVYQETNYKDGTQVPGLYRAANELVVIIKKLELTGTIIDAAVKAGANQLSSLVFYASKTEDAYNEARVLAVTQAANKAAILTKAAGAKLGKVLSIQESGGQLPRFEERNLRMKAAADSLAETPVNPGTNELSISVTIEYQLD